MPILSDLYDEFTGIVHDPQWDSDTVIQLFNTGIGDIAAQIIIPNLLAIATITTDATGKNYVPLPADYNRHLSWCYSQTYNRPIKLFGSVPLLLRCFWRLDLPGRVIGATVQGLNLFYQRIPSTPETLQINYVAKPADLLENDDTDIYLPVFAHDLLLNYACWKAYSVIEEGMDGSKTQTGYYLNEYNKALSKFNDFIGPERNPPFNIGDELQLDYRDGRMGSGWNGGFFGE